jgi:hypothetical protein
VYCFEEIMGSFPQAKCIHIVRHPRDCIASLVNRGMPVYQAVAVYMLNTREGIKHQNNPLCYTIKYESLVHDPEVTMRALFDFLGLPFETSVLEPDQQSDGIDYMQGWNYKESAAIGARSVGRFEALDSHQKNEINSHIAAMHIVGDNDINNVKAIAMKLNYSMESIPGDSRFLRKLKKEKQYDILKRILKNAYFNISNYPIDVRN